MPILVVILALGLLPLDVVLADERLVLDENDEPSEIIELGRCTNFVFPTMDEVEELRSFGAVNIYFLSVITLIESFGSVNRFIHLFLVAKN